MSWTGSGICRNRKKQDYDIICNGKKCEETKDYFLDRKMIRYYIPELKTGRNEITVKRIYLNETELEDIYIIGNFMVDKNRRIGKDEGRLHFGDWTMQGLFHYPGSVTYRFLVEKIPQKGKRYELKTEEFWGTLGKVRVNNKEAGVLISTVCEKIDITDYLKQGCNDIEIEIAGSPRKSLWV